jgi:hypothetical protein
MAATFAPRASLVPSQQHTATIPGWTNEDTIEITAGTADYPTGGYAFGNAQLQTMYGGAYSTLVSVDVVDNWRTAAGGGVVAYLAVYDSVNQKVQAYTSAGAAPTAFAELPAANAGLNGLRCSIRIRFI